MVENSITLSAAELVCLFRQLGGNVLPGVTDPYRQLDKAEQTQLAIAAEDSLRDRGLCKRMFGGKVVYDEGLASLFEICVGFARYIGFDYRDPGERLNTRRFYGLNGRWLEISGEAEAFCLKECSAREVRERLRLLPTAQAADVNVLIPKKDFKVLGRLIQRGRLGEAQQLMAEMDIAPEGRALMLEGMQFQTEYYAITLADRTADELALRNAAALRRDQTMAEFYSTVAEDDRTMIGLRSAASGDYRALLECAQSWLDAEPEVRRI